jgi:hypothetical protein
MSANVVNPDFMSLSEFLLGVPFQPPLPPLDALDPNLGLTYYQRLISEANGPPGPPGPNQFPTGVTPPGGSGPDPNWSITPDKMTQLLGVWHPLASLPPDQQQAQFKAQIQGSTFYWPLAQQIVMAWYTGVCANVGRTADLYESTLVWVLAQAHPMAVPLSFGYWQYPASGS